MARKQPPSPLVAALANIGVFIKPIPGGAEASVTIKPEQMINARVAAASLATDLIRLAAQIRTLVGTVEDPAADAVSKYEHHGLDGHRWLAGTADRLF